jgi:hypothetical protein
VGWQDREWAKWTEDERRRYVGGGTAIVPGAFLAVVVSLVAAVVLAPPFRTRHVVRPPVYGTGVVVRLMNQNTTCTEQRLDSGRWQCARWAILLPGQRALPAAPPAPGSLCAVVVVDQASRRWICGTPS